MNVSSSTPPIQFGTDGWRGIIAQDFTFANVRKVTRAIASYLKATYSQKRPVLIGYDTRFLAETFAQAAAEILVELGWSVKITQRDCPTPAIAYSARALNSAGALMFTASHNPAIYCGIKYIPDYGGPATTAITNAIVAHLAAASDAPATPQGGAPLNIDVFDPQPAYLNSLYALIDEEQIRRAGFKVKYDALYSTSRGYLDSALAHCGCQVEAFHTYRDVLFGGGMPEPTEEQLTQLVRAVQRDGADVGLATDGDSDRFGIIDEQGHILAPNTVLLLLARHLVKHKGKHGAIVRTVATTHLLDKFAVAHGLKVYETPVGFKHVGQKMRETEVLIGGEESGGLSVIGHIPEKDGILANLLVVEAMAYEGKPLSQLVQDVIAETGTLCNQRIDLPLTTTYQTAVLNAFTAGLSRGDEVAGIPVQAIGLEDGVKLYLEDGSWVLLRPSGTEPLLRLYVETDSYPKAAHLLAWMQQTLQKLDF